MDELISRQALLDKFEPWLKVKDYNDGELNVLKAILYEIRFMRSAQPVFDARDTQYNLPIGTDCISRQAAIDALRNYLVGKNVPCDGTLTCRLIENEVISKLPSAQPKRGKWHYSNGKPATIGRSFGVICDQCGTESEYCTNFCGECGADMREVTT